VYIQSTDVPSQAVYLYLQTTVPSQINGLGICVELTKVAAIVLPQASIIGGGVLGFTAEFGHEIVDAPAVGGINPPE
jgi:hypothetical protein